MLETHTIFVRTHNSLNAVGSLFAEPTGTTNERGHGYALELPMFLQEPYLMCRRSAYDRSCVRDTIFVLAHNSLNAVSQPVC